MNKIDSAVANVCRLDELASRDIWINSIHPLAKLAATVAYIVTVVSFPRDAAAPLFAAFAWPVSIFALADISFKGALRMLRVVLPLVCLVGAASPIFEGRAGVIPMITLAQKGVLAVLASYILIATTSIEAICSALRAIKIPAVIVLEVMLIHRYMTLLLRESSRVWNAYSLRAPAHRGIDIKAWGSLVGMMLMRSFDRARDVYDSMHLRGWDGRPDAMCRARAWRAADTAYIAACAAIFALLRAAPVVISIW